MAVIISSKNNEKTFTEKEIINIGSNPSCDFVMNIGVDFMLTLQLNQQNKFVILNNFQKVKQKGFNLRNREKKAHLRRISNSSRRN